MSEPFQPLLALVLYVPRCLLLYPPQRYYWTLPSSSCRRTGGHGDPNRGTLPGETAWPSICHRRLPPFLFPSLSFIPLSFSYLHLLLFAFTPFPSFPFGILLPTPPFSWNGLAPRSSHIAAAPIYSCPGRPLGREEGQTGKTGRRAHRETEERGDTQRRQRDREFRKQLLEKGTRTTLCTVDSTIMSSPSSFLNKLWSYLLLHSSLWL